MLKKNLKLFRSKKAVNDITIMNGIITVFMLLGITLPFINDAFDNPTSPNFDASTMETNVGEDVDSVSAINAFHVLLSILKMFFWTFGDLPFWLDGIFVIFRIMLAMIVARNIWIGGGG